MNPRLHDPATLRTAILKLDGRALDRYLAGRAPAARRAWRAADRLHERLRKRAA